MLKHRLIIGHTLALLVILVVWADDALSRVPAPEWWIDEREYLPGGLLIFLGCMIIVPFAAVELSRIFEANRIPTRRWLTAMAALLGVILSYAIPTKLNEPTDIAIAFAIIPTGLIVMFLASIVVFSRRQNVEGVVAGAGAVVFAMVYLGLMLGFLVAIRRWHSAWWIVGIIAITKMCDTGAYFTGRALGRHKLIPWLSPGKTWEGLLGGVICSALTGVLVAYLSHLLPPPLDPELPDHYDHVPLWVGAFCGVIFALVGQFGDLAMSLFKRDAGFKDASNMLPGMGGVLDVMDSPLMVAPVAYWILMLWT